MTATRKDHENDDAVDARVADLPRLAPDPRTLAQGHQRARAAFVAAGAVAPGAAGAGSRGRWWGTLWNRALEPIIVVGIVVGYLSWTAAAMGALHP